MKIETGVRKVLEYHTGSKHHPHRFAPGPGRMDWANEPNPFRRYDGATIIPLPLLEADPQVDHFGLYRRQVEPRPLNLSSIGSLLELSLGLSAWKSYGGNSWSLRMNPSSGDLHPTECHLAIPPQEDIPGGIFHYETYRHVLEHRATAPTQCWEPLPRGGFLLALTSILWREAWKYGVRAFRYCAQDIGHALACVSFSAALLGWKVTLLEGVADEEIATLLGFREMEWPEQEMEMPQCLLLVGPDDGRELLDFPPEWFAAFASLPFTGIPNRLSSEHRAWSAIGEVAVATLKSRTVATPCHFPDAPYLEEEITRTAAGTIRQRRSALSLDGRTRIPAEAFFGILDKTLPRSGNAPFDLGSGATCVHLFLFVHRVEGLPSGLYCLVRNDADLEELQRECSTGFLWRKVAAEVPLFLLEGGEYRRSAALASCDQEIAAEGAFACAMVGRFRSVVESAPWRYRHLHWEAGMVGQVLYLEAEAHGMRGTGMGCFFDDVTHQLLGLSGDRFQDFYHFTVGKAVEDRRITTRPPYGHLRKG